jgi:hypothetical protein
MANERTAIHVSREPVARGAPIPATGPDRDAAPAADRPAASALDRPPALRALTATDADEVPMFGRMPA